MDDGSDVVLLHEVEGAVAGEVGVDHVVASVGVRARFNDIGKGLDHGAYESQDLVTCPADFDYNGKVDFMDLMDILKNWGDCDGCPQDLDGTDYVDGTDLYYLIISWGNCG